MTTKKIISVVTSIALLSGALCAAPLQQGSTSLFSAPIVAEAAVIQSGAQSHLVYNIPGSKGKLYFWQDPTDNHLEVCGSLLNASNTEIDIPNTFRVGGVSYPVKAILFHAFDGQTNLRRISNTTGAITKIGEAAFYGCTNLEYVAFQNGKACSVKEIGVCAFQDCTSLQDAYFISKAEVIGNHAFWNCTSLQYNHGGTCTLDFYNLRKLGVAAFYNCSAIKSINLADSSIKSIPNFAFWNCANVKTVHLPDTVKSIGIQAFSNCDSLEKIYIPDSVTSIDTAAFISCDSLKTVMMSENMGHIGDHAFHECPQMKYFVCKVMYPYVGNYAFGWHTENGHLVRNQDFVIWGKNSGSVQDYATQNGLTFRDFHEASALASARYTDYEWSVENANDQWYNNGNYYFNAAHLPYANGYAGQESGGICTGMAAISALTSSGYLSVSDYAPGYNKLRNITTIPRNTASYATTVWANQNMDQNDYALEGSTNKFGKEMLRYAEYITYGADAAVVDIRSGSHAHSMVCFGMEFKADAADRNSASWNGKDARIMLYDVNTSQHYTGAYVYVNLTDGSWSCTNTFTHYKVTNASNYNFSFSHTPETIVSTLQYGITADEFFDTIRN